MLKNYKNVQCTILLLMTIKSNKKDAGWPASLKNWELWGQFLDTSILVGE